MSAILNALARLNATLNAAVWGAPMLLLIIGTGIYLTARTRFFQFAHVRHILSRTLFAIFRKSDVHKSGDERAISQFQALATALAATTGTGNIAGVAAAIAIGGPGAVLWMWVSALFGMATGYAENVLGIYFRRRNARGEWSGGPMYYIEAGLSKSRALKRFARPLAVLFAAFCALASFGIGNMTQVNTVSEVMRTNFSVPGWATGLAVSGATALVILGSIRRIARVTEKLVPFMSIFYIAAALAVLILNAGQIPHVFGTILKSAFCLRAALGGAGGMALRRAVTMGFKRGVFSNEAGLGSTVIVHAASDAREPAAQGMWAIFEVFFNTLVLCTLTAFALLSSTVSGLPSLENANLTARPGLISLAGHARDHMPLIGAERNELHRTSGAGGTVARLTVDGAKREILVRGPEGDRDLTYANVMLASAYDADGDGIRESARFEELAGVSLVALAFSRHFGSAAGAILALTILFFAFSTVLGWSFYGMRSVEYLFGARAATPYRIAYILFAFLGAVMSQNLAWDVADTLNGLMAFPNLIGILCLSGLVVRITRNYTARNITKKAPDAPPLLSFFTEASP